MENHDKSTGKILIIRNSAMGDVAMTIPVIYSFAKAYPGKEIYVLTRPFFARLFINAPKNVKLITADYRKDYAGMAGTAKLIRDLGKYGFSEVADFHDVVRSWTIDAYFKSKGKKVRKLDKDRNARMNLLRDRNIQKPYIDRYVRVLNSLGYEFPLTFESLYGSGKPESTIEIKHPALGIAPFARYATKVYPAELLGDMIGELEEMGINIYLFGGKDDAPAIAKILEAHPGCTSVAGKFPIEDELKIMSNMDLMLTMDSANQHLASLVGVRAITFWGSTVPYGGFLGYRQRQEDAYYADLDCQPCSISGTQKCPLNISTECMRVLNRSLITAKIAEILKGK